MQSDIFTFQNILLVSLKSLLFRLIVKFTHVIFLVYRTSTSNKASFLFYSLNRINAFILGSRLGQCRICGVFYMKVKSFAKMVTPSQCGGIDGCE